MTGLAPILHSAYRGLPARVSRRCPCLLQALLILSALLADAQALAAGEPSRGGEGYAFTDDDRLASAAEFAPWADMLRRRAAEAFSLEACINAPAACPPALRGARTVVLRGRSLGEREQLDLVNRFVNRRRYVEGAVDRRWETPASFLRRGGDCEDYAEAKYFLLRAIGVATDDLRVVVGRTRRSGGNHALLAVRTGAGDVLLLDTDDRTHAGERRSDYAYLYSVNEDGLWDHVGPRPTDTDAIAATGHRPAGRARNALVPGPTSALPNPATDVANENED